MQQGTILKVSGPLVVAKGMRNANMFDVVRVSEQRLIGEIMLPSRCMRRLPAWEPAPRWSPPASL